jgi:hypothetical protein
LVISLLLDWARQVWGSVEHSKGKGRKSVVVVRRFLCGSPYLCRLKTTPFWPRRQSLSFVLTACQVLWGPLSQVAFVTTLSNRISLLDVVLLLLEGEWGWVPKLHLGSRDLWMIFIRESLQESSVCRVGQVLPLQGMYQFKSTRHSRLWVVACHCSHLVVYWRTVDGFDELDMDMVMIILLLWLVYLLTFDVDMGQHLFILVLVCRCKHSTWQKIKMTKIIKAHDQLLVVEYSVSTNP